MHYATSASFRSDMLLVDGPMNEGNAQQFNNKQFVWLRD